MFKAVNENIDINNTLKLLEMKLIVFLCSMKYFWLLLTGHHSSQNNKESDFNCITIQYCFVYALLVHALMMLYIADLLAATVNWIRRKYHLCCKVTENFHSAEFDGFLYIYVDNLAKYHAVIKFYKFG